MKIIKFSVSFLCVYFVCHFVIRVLQIFVYCRYKTDSHLFICLPSWKASEPIQIGQTSPCACANSDQELFLADTDSVCCLYCIYLKYLDRQVWADSVDTDQTLQKSASDQCLHCLLSLQQSYTHLWLGPVAQLVAHLTADSGVAFESQLIHIIFVDIAHEIISTVIHPQQACVASTLSRRCINVMCPLGSFRWLKLLVTGASMCTSIG